MSTIKKLLFITLTLSLTLSFNVKSQEVNSSAEIKNGNLSAKEDINPLRIGVKAGIPSIFNINIEYVTPLLDNRVAFAIDYFPLKINVSDTEAKFKNFEIGSNIYIKNTGKGIYGGLSYYKFDAHAKNIDTDFDDGSSGPGETTIKFNTFNLKVGAKLGKAFYFRIELGYGFGNIPETIVITSEDGNSSTTEGIEEAFSYIGNAGVPIFNFGIGYSFL